MSNSAKVQLSIKALEVLNEGIKAGVVPSDVLENIDLRNGTSSGQIDLVFADTETGKAASGTTTYALDGSVNDSFGNAITFVKVVLVLIRNKRTTTNAWLKVGPNAVNGFGTISAEHGFWADATDRSVVNEGGWYVAYDPAGVAVDGTHSDLDVATSAVVGDTNTWDILILGRSA